VATVFRILWHISITGKEEKEGDDTQPRAADLTEPNEDTSSKRGRNYRANVKNRATKGGKFIGDFDSRT